MLERGSFFLLCLLAIVLPFEAYLTVGRVWELTPVKLIFVLMVLLLAAAALLQRPWPSRLPALFIPAALLCIAFLAAVPGAEEFQVNAFKSALRYGAGLVLYVAVFLLAGRKPDTRRRQLAACLWIGALASSVIGLTILADLPWTGDLARLFRPFEYYIYFNWRFSATLDYPNIAANYLLLTLPLAVMWGSAFKSPIGRLLAQVGLALPMLVGLAFTYSRGGNIACLLGCLVAAWCARRSSSRREAGALAGAALAIGLLSLMLNTRPLLMRNETRSSVTQPAINAAYELSETRIQRDPGQFYETDVRVTNTGSLAWVNSAKEPLVLASRWYDVNRRKAVWVEPISTDLPAELPPGKSLWLKARYRTPYEEGYYYLIWELFQYRDRMPWSTGRRIDPGVADCFISREPLDLQSMPYHVNPNKPQGGVAGAGSGENGPSRLQLWQVAMTLFQQHPWTGIGGGNFRLVYGRYLNMSSWDTRVQANSMVMEIAAGCGLLGLAALLFFAWKVIALLALLRRELLAPPEDGRGAARALQLGLIAAVIGFGLHNLIDYFMEFTPTYLAFWMILGLLSAGHGSGAGKS